MKTEKEKELNRKMVLDYAGEKSKEKEREEFDINREFVHCGDFELMLVKNNSLMFKLTNSIVKLYVLSNKIAKIEMFKYPKKDYSDGEKDKFFKKICEKEFKASLAIYKKQWNNFKFGVEEAKDKIFIDTGMINIEINKRPFNIRYLHDKMIINEDFESKGMGSFGQGVCAYKKLDNSEHFYGFGEKTGGLDKRQWETIQWNTDNPEEHNDETKSLYCSIPFFIGLRNKKAYGIYFDNTHKTYFNMGKDDSDYYYYFAADKGELVYYFIYGPSMKEVIEGYTEITGRMKMPPMWSLGYQQCRWSYCPENQVLELAKTFREKDIPCDTIYLDIDYMDGFRVFTWDKERFPNHKDMINQLHDMGFKLVTIIDPGVKVDEKYKVYNEGTENNYFLKDHNGNIFSGKVWPMDSVFPDFSNNKVRTWWGNLNAELIKQGVDGIWNDMNEPSLFDTKSGTLPKDLVHNSDDRTMFHEEFHNLYGMIEDKATFNGIKNAFPDKRVFLLSRSGFAGLQRYSALWTGDNQSLWEHIKLSIPMNCNLGLSGISFIGNDIGGFGGNCTSELLIRWTQLGTFIPMFRNHSAIGTINQEPWAFDKQTEDICRKYIKFRYELLPYLYNLFYDSVKHGEPVLRPLIYEFQEDNEVVNINDEFMFGENVLIAPILEKGCTERKVYLPQGNWINYYTMEQHKGKATINVSAPLEIIPVFVKEGSIIPKYKTASSTSTIDKNILLLDIIPNMNSKAEYNYYEDDGKSFNYEKGEYNITKISLEENRNKYKLEVKKIYKGYEKSFDKLYVNIINSVQPQKIKFMCKDSEISDIAFTYTNNTISFNIETKNDFCIEIQK
ncbi:glycoside hydrolase family 31 protein [Clostridium brassicae]|uniref:DUF5110 domain-containing protein n=1 Tax=Clostridium brassicae TaxID=2999072 RepID=A0ABT4DBW8_9CLOT|nr:TIM-barrel domain-containing protein [Clostridium brassicae]MCY6958651.1 DUF5110 domain-containing protein [Clostridium brassicae]